MSLNCFGLHPNNHFHCYLAWKWLQFAPILNIQTSWGIRSSCSENQPRVYETSLLPKTRLCSECERSVLTSKEVWLTAMHWVIYCPEHTHRLVTMRLKLNFMTPSGWNASLCLIHFLEVAQIAPPLFKGSITSFPLNGVKPSDSKLTFLSFTSSLWFFLIFFYGPPLAVCVLSAANALKVVFRFHRRVDVSCLLDSY